MIRRKTAVFTTAAALGTVVAAAGPASAGGVGDFLSPAFGTSCGNHNTGARIGGTTTHGTGAANGNLAGLPISSALNQCGGADLSPRLHSLARSVDLDALAEREEFLKAVRAGR
ncbi:hypothetical protein [Streptomyces sp. WAC05374]|uniref:hypothetical protein n=1 Tax=Streptomyces sp. WAC05374 TaxID=2487420 RepID=UPI000F874128|nr:hypothetical protein [Streptomyces sp. WAC05374]